MSQPSMLLSSPDIEGHWQNLGGDNIADAMPQIADYPTAAVARGGLLIWVWRWPAVGIRTGQCVRTCLIGIDRNSQEAVARVMASMPASCPSFTRGKYAYDFCDTGEICPIRVIYLNLTCRNLRQSRYGFRHIGFELDWKWKTLTTLKLTLTNSRENSCGSVANAAFL